RSALYFPMTKNFPKNTEVEAIITLTGNATGALIRSVTPSPDAVTVRQRHSFIELPDDQYEPREFDPRAGFFSISYMDFTTPISEPIVKRFISRHRLEKKDPKAAVSEAVEPIVYYLDRGTPEPVASALIEGGNWWNQAFEAAGFKNAFRVELAPEGMDLMDVRYNVIQWVHRSTRGWSYGSSVRDPRTGEIIKGHVSLGSLRVRQDYLIAQGLLQPFEDGKPADPKMLEMALARLRQLSAHEIGHTIGLAHSYATSAVGRVSVMDYPYPLITQNAQGELDLSNAYDDKIGAWDKWAITYGYGYPSQGQTEETFLKNTLEKTYAEGYEFITDSDSRDPSGAHPRSHLWDNGESAPKELMRMLGIRSNKLKTFGLNAIPDGTPEALLEEVLVPLYLMHRYQVEATSKLIGGL
ncbi:MAG TPA: peptidase, partial [Algoriphagus sp.]|nr:peptidase [Algoriphagus sp.]